MSRVSVITLAAALSALATLSTPSLAGNAIPPTFTTSYLDGTSWNTVYTQGFSPSLSPLPNPGLPPASAVSLTKFEFFKSGNADGASNIRLAIINNIFTDLTGLTTSSPSFVGLSSNTIASTAPIATGNPIAFDFASLPLIFGNNYAAVYVNVGADQGGGVFPLTPILVSSLVTDYVETPPGSGSFHPATNYGTEAQFQFATSNFIATNQFGSFFNTFSFAGDANFRATFSTSPVPEPASLTLLTLGTITLLSRRRKSF